VDEGTHGARQRGEKSLCAGAIEGRGRGSGRLRLRIVPDASAAALGGFVAASVESGAIVRTDGWPGYAGSPGLGFDHRPRGRRALSALGSKEDLGPRLHRAVSNLKSWLRGTHRGVSRDHLQVYLDQFVFRFDRRGSPMAAFLLGLGSMHPPMTYQQITRRNQAAA
jgi:ISXO2-like transposase domain